MPLSSTFLLWSPLPFLVSAMEIEGGTKKAVAGVAFDGAKAQAWKGSGICSTTNEIIQLFKKCSYQNRSIYLDADEEAPED